MWHLCRTELRRQLLDYVLNALDQSRAFLDKSIAAAGLAAQGTAGHRENLAILLECHARGDERTALLGSLDNHDAQAKSRDQPIARGKILRHRRCTERQLGNQRPSALDYGLGQLAVLGRINDIHSAAHYRDSAPASVKCSLMSVGIDSAGETADDGISLGGE